MQAFRDRRDAGCELARRLDHLAGNPDVVVLALPRGGVPVGYEIARRLVVPLDVLVVRKLGVPGHSELAMGAIASGGVEVVDRYIVGRLGIPHEIWESVACRERGELARREAMFRGGRPALDVTGKIAIVVDDGLATGSTMAAALNALRTRDPARLIVAVPVAPRDALSALEPRTDEMICLATPRQMHAVSLWYEDFTQTTDDEVRELLATAARERTAGGIEAAQPARMAR